MAYWYTAPAHDSTGEDPINGSIHPCRTGVCKGIPKGIERVHAYEPEGSPTTCLVGVAKEITIPGWTSRTLQQAKDAFNTHYGRQPSDTEVY